MKISIYNFKTIKDLTGFEIKPITIMSGVNSSGKTSFIQFILFLKQTLEKGSSKTPFVIDGAYVKSKDIEDLIFQKKSNNKIQFSITYDKNELDKIDKDRISIFDHLQDVECAIMVKYDFIDGDYAVSEFQVKYIVPDFTKKEQWIRFTYNQNKKDEKEFIIEANSGIFGVDFDRQQAKDNQTYYLNKMEDLYESFDLAEKNNSESLLDDISKKIHELVEEWKLRKPLLRGEVNLNVIFPSFVEEIVPNGDLDDSSFSPTKKEIYEPKIKGLQKLTEDIFSNITYIGPLREEPKDFYNNTEDSYIGERGQYTAAILSKEADKSLEYFQFDTKENDSIFYNLTKSNLKDAVKYWICDVFNLAKDIKAEEYKDNFRIFVIDHNNIAVSIKHVGFGISQILPIIVEGLRMSNEGILILEQPEIHLHPKIQSLLFDFLYSLTLSGKKIIVETHSDHFITSVKI